MNSVLLSKGLRYLPAVKRLAIIATFLGCAGGETSTEEKSVCADGVLLGQPFEAIINPAVEVQIGVTTFDGQVWATYNSLEQEGASFIDTFIAPIGCTGEKSNPLRVNTIGGNNDADASLAANGDRLFITWGISGGQGSYNAAGYRVYDASAGDFVQDSEQNIITKQADGSDALVNHWLPQATKHNDGFAATGVRAVTEGFTVFVQTFDSDGELVSTLAPAEQDTHNAVYPQITSDDNDDLWVTWEKSEKAPDAPTSIALATIASEATSWSGVAKNLSPDDNGSQPRLSQRGWEYAPLAIHRNSLTEQLTLNYQRSDGTDGTLTLGAAGKSSQLASIATAPGGEGVVTWHEIVAGQQNKVIYAPLTFDGKELQVGAPVTLEENALPYGPAITHVRDNIYFVAWTKRRADGTECTDVGQCKMFGQYIEI